MRCSPEKLAANRKNSQKSTGPVTPEGKSKSRRNGLKHGLTGSGIVIPDEDVQAVAGRFEAFEEDLKPRNGVARFLTQRAALLSVRLERAARQESAKITGDMLAAEGAEADARAEELARLIDSIKEQPATAVRNLERSAEGIDWLIQSWNSVKLGLLDRKCYRWDQPRALRLSGLPPERGNDSPFTVLTYAMNGRFDGLPDNRWSDLPDPERREAARMEMAAIIDAEIAQLERLRQGLDHEAIARDREGARARAIFDPSKEATLARKYEAAAERGFFKTIKEIERINATAEESSESDTSPESVEDCGELASSFPARGGVSNRFESRQATSTTKTPRAGEWSVVRWRRGKAWRRIGQEQSAINNQPVPLLIPLGSH